MEVNETKKRAIKSLLEILKINQKDLAKEINITEQVLSKFFTNNTVGMRKKKFETLTNFLKSELEKRTSLNLFQKNEAKEIMKVILSDNEKAQTYMKIIPSKIIDKTKEETSRTKLIEEVINSYFLDRTSHLAKQRNQLFEETFDFVYGYGLDAVTNQNFKLNNENKDSKIFNLPKNEEKTNIIPFPVTKTVNYGHLNIATRSTEVLASDKKDKKYDLIKIDELINFDDLYFQVSININIRKNDIFVECKVFPIINTELKNFELEGIIFEIKAGDKNISQESKGKFSIQHIEGSRIKFDLYLTSEPDKINFYGRTNIIKYPEEIAKYKSLVLKDYKIKIDLPDTPETV